MIAQHAAGSPVRHLLANWGGGVLGRLYFKFEPLQGRHNLFPQAKLCRHALPDTQ
jgi:hypothetical protein